MKNWTKITLSFRLAFSVSPPLKSLYSFLYPKVESIFYYTNFVILSS
jgi:hypothetical protein